MTETDTQVQIHPLLLEAYRLASGSRGFAYRKFREDEIIHLRARAAENAKIRAEVQDATKRLRLYDETRTKLEARLFRSLYTYFGAVKDRFSTSELSTAEAIHEQS